MQNNIETANKTVTYSDQDGDTCQVALDCDKLISVCNTASGYHTTVELDRDQALHLSEHLKTLAEALPTSLLEEGCEGRYTFVDSAGDPCVLHVYDNELTLWMRDHHNSAICLTPALAKEMLPHLQKLAESTD